jgi:hypothetical protein
MVAMLNFDLPHHVTHVDKRRISQLLLGKERTALEVKFVETGQSTVDTHAVISLKQLDHFDYIDAVVGGVGGDLLEEDLVNVD